MGVGSLDYVLLNDSSNDYSNIEQTIFNNRGIYDIEQFKKCDSSSLYDYNDLKNIDFAYDCFVKHLNNKSNFCIVVDCDVDGYVSASMLYKVIKQYSPDIHIQYIIHNGKEHGLDDVYNEIESSINVVIVPDAGSNDVESCSLLKDKGIDVIVLDHHNIEVQNVGAIVVNCKDGLYQNPDLCGAGVVLKYLEKYDDQNWTQYSQNYLDMVAFATLADMMDLTNKENRYIVKAGLHNLKNNFLKSMVENVYNFPKDFTTQDVQMKLIPLVNGCIRMGSQEDKDILFKAFADIDSTIIFEREYRGKKYKEDIYKKAIRICTNAKSRQDSIVNKATPIVVSQIEPESGFVLCDLTNLNIKGIEVCTGLLANKLANKYHKPCIVIRQNDNIIGGSGRNFNGSSVRSLKDLLSEWDCFDQLQGHDNAFGVLVNNLDKLILHCKNTHISIKNQCVDFIIPNEDFRVGMISDAIKAQECLGRGYEPIRFAITNVKVENFQLMGEQNNHWKFISDEEGITFVNFNIPNDDVLAQMFNENWEIDENTYINIVGGASLNYYNSIITPQIIVEEYEIVGG